jgi:hypothetical protein
MAHDYRDHVESDPFETELLPLQVELLSSFEAVVKRAMRSTEIDLMRTCTQVFATVCRTNGLHEPVVVGNVMFETILLSQMDNLRSAARQDVITFLNDVDLLKPVSSTSAIFERPIVSMMSFTPWDEGDRRRLFHALRRVLPTFEEHVAHVVRFKRDFLCSFSHPDWSLEDIQIGTLRTYDPTVYLNVTHISDALRMNRLAEESTTCKYILHDRVNSLLRVYVEQTDTFEGQLMGQISLPIICQFRHRTGRRACMHTVDVAIARLYVTGPAHPGYAVRANTCKYILGSCKVTSFTLQGWARYVTAQIFRRSGPSVTKAHWLGVVLPFTVKALERQDIERLQFFDPDADVYHPLTSLLWRTYDRLKVDAVTDGARLVPAAYARVFVRPRDTMRVRGRLDHHAPLSEHPQMRAVECDDGVFAPVHVAYLLNCTHCVRTVSKAILRSFDASLDTRVSFIEPTTLDDIVLT